MRSNLLDTSGGERSHRWTLVDHWAGYQLGFFASFREAVLGSHGSDISNRQSVRTSTTSETRQMGPVEVEIQGQTLSIRSDRDPEFVRKLAAYVDEKLGQLRDSAPKAPTDKLLMMTSLTLAEELFEARSQLEETQADIEERASTMRKLLEQLDSSG